MLRLGMILSLGLILAGCAQRPKLAKDNDVTGTYALISVNGANVPAIVTHGGARLQVRSGTFTINADGTCDSKVVFVPPSGSETSREVRATYSRLGSKLKMRWEGAGITTGSVQGNTFTMNNEGSSRLFS
jgi:hypothetical protein